MPSDDHVRCTPHYRLLAPAQIERLHAATLQLLETAGVRIRHAGARRMLADAGCRLGDDERVRIPGAVVEKAIASAPGTVTVYDRGGREAMRLGGNRCFFGMGTDLARTWDLETGELRESCLRDVATAAHIADALPGIDFIASYAIPNDSPPNLMYLDAFMAQATRSSKPIFFTAAGVEDLRVIREMAVAVTGGEAALRLRPFLIHYAEPLSPLVHSAGAVEKLLFCADHGIPVTYTPGMMSGATAPVTLAGALTVGNAEALSGVVMHQLRAPGAPIISGIGMATLDMARATCIYGCPEYRLALSACADLYHHYRIPVWGTAGVTDANGLDQQAGMEWGVSLTINALAGANLIHDVGYMDCGTLATPDALVLCQELIGMVRAFGKGICTDPDHLALDVIDEVGPGGEFLTHDHTYDHWREWFLPKLQDRSDWETWLSEGQKTMADRVREETERLLASYQPEPLDEGLHVELEAVVKAADERHS